jgi:hypothetical protein
MAATAVAAYGVTAAIAHFIAVEATVRMFDRVFAAFGHMTVIAVMHIEVVIYMAAEVVTAVKPRAGSDEDTT